MASFKSISSCALVIYLCVQVYSAELPNFSTKCTKDSDDFTKCLLDNANTAIVNLNNEKGYPKYRLQNINAIHADKVTLQDTKDLKIFLDDIVFRGTADAKVTDIKLTDDELTLKIEGPQLQVVGNYDISGRILILPIQGKGDMNITFSDFELNYKGKLQQEERKGKKYFKLENDDTSNIEITRVKRIYYQLNNLFNGDERLGPEMNRFLNENWSDVFQELKGPMEKACAYVLVNYYVNGFFRSVPIDELFN